MFNTGSFCAQCILPLPIAGKWWIERLAEWFIALKNQLSVNRAVRTPQFLSMALCHRNTQKVFTVTLWTKIHFVTTPPLLINAEIKPSILFIQQQIHLIWKCLSIYHYVCIIFPDFIRSFTWSGRQFLTCQKNR